MGLILEARCGGCGYQAEGLRLGGSHAQIAAHDVSAYELFRAPCCSALQSVLVYLGAPYPEVPCDACGEPLTPTPERRYRIATLKGEVLAGHACPRCDARTLEFVPTQTFV